MILLFRSNNIFASRVNKYVNFYQRSDIDYTVIGWDRKAEGLSKEHYDFFRYKAGTAVGGLRGVINHIRWMIFVYKYIKAHPAATTIHACDLNSAFPATLYKRIHNKNLNVIFDACDWFSAEFANNNSARRILQFMEKFTCKWADNLIICEPEREEQITFKLKEKPLVLRNIPEIDKSIVVNEGDDKYRFENDWPTLAYFGGLVNSRYLDELFSLARTEKFNMLVGGFGSADREALCRELDQLPNFRYFGRMTMVDGLQMSNNADIIYAMYCKNNLNHIYAAPNKLYEAMFLGKPIITTKGTLPGKKVVDNNIGWAIDENTEELIHLLRSIDNKSIKEKGQNSKRLWNEKYKDDVSKFFNEVYTKIIK
jgi:glycosyltransferase involved in cell wall biosynthesis